MDLSVGSALGWVALGLAVGVLGRLVPGHEAMGWVGSLLAAVAGAVVGGLVAYVLKLSADPYSPAGWIVSVISAALALAFYHSAVTVRRRPV